MKTYLLKNGRIIDGSGADSFVGDVLIKGRRIEKVSAEPIVCPEAEVIDCTGLAVAPGFIDGHSHQDFFFMKQDAHPFFDPFIQQGITTFICGNCGFGAAGYKEGSPYKHDIAASSLGGGLKDAAMDWNSWPEYFGRIEENGMLANMAVLAAHGAALGSILGTGTLGEGAVTPEIEQEVLELLERGMDDGCLGVSMGLAYRPGNFTTKEQLRHIAEIVAKHGKILTIHRQVETALSGYYSDFNEPHNVRWLREFFDNIKDTGVKVHISHLLFAGRTTFPSYDAMHAMINEYAAKGLDVSFDMYSYEYGATECAILVAADLPQDMEAMKTDKALHDRRAAEFDATGELVGMFNDDVFLANPIIPEFEPYKGMFLSEMAQARGMTPFDNVVDLYEKTEGHASVMLSPYYSSEMTVDQMQDPLCDYQTDAWIEPGCAANPSAFGAFPRFLRLGREQANMRLEDVVRKMTGRTAERFQLKQRGFLRGGYYADVTVFDPDNVKETATPRDPSGTPEGIKKVFLNGQLVLDDGKVIHAPAGMVIC